MCLIWIPGRRDKVSTVPVGRSLTTRRLFLAVCWFLIFSTSAFAYEFLVAVPELNLRTGPGSEYRSLGLLRYNDHVNVVETREEWYRIEIAEGWVAAPLSGASAEFFLEAQSPDSFSRIAVDSVEVVGETMGVGRRFLSRVRLLRPISGWVPGKYLDAQQNGPSPSFGPRLRARHHLISVNNMTEEEVRVWLHYEEPRTRVWETNSFVVGPHEHTELKGTMTKSRFVFVRAESKSESWVPRGERISRSLDGSPKSLGVIDLGSDYGMYVWTIQP